MTPPGDISVAELSRQVRDVLLRFQGLADRLDTTYATKETFMLYQELVNQALAGLQDKYASLERDKTEKTFSDGIERRLAAIEDNQKWLTRLVLALVVTAIVAGVLVSGKR